VIAVGLFLFALACIGAASSALDPEESKDSLTLDALLFLLCLVGVVHASSQRKRANEDEE
jgi:hypothetical protein